jgi:hypothetical protein
MGVPRPDVALRFLRKYWLEMGPVAGLLLGQLALVPLLAKKAPISRIFYGLGLVVMLCFVLSHMDEDLAGASELLGLVHHSMPRYWSPIYLLAALPPILLLARCQRPGLFAVGVALMCALAMGNAYEIGKREGSSLFKLYQYAQRWERIVPSLADTIPNTAMVYSATYDKVLWPYWRVGTVAEPEPTASSMRRAIDSDFQVFVFEPRFPRAQATVLQRALRAKALSMVAIDRQGLYRVMRARP